MRDKRIIIWPVLLILLCIGTDLIGAKYDETKSLEARVTQLEKDIDTLKFQLENNVVTRHELQIQINEGPPPGWYMIEQAKALGQIKYDTKLLRRNKYEYKRKHAAKRNRIYKNARQQRGIDQKKYAESPCGRW